MSQRSRPRFAPLLLAALATVAGAADLEGIELVGFGDAGDGQAYATGRFVPLRYRLRGEADRGDPVDVVLRRDDGATVIIPAVRERNQVLVSEVPLRPDRFTLTEYEGFALVRGGGLFESPEPLAIVQLGEGDAASRGAGVLERSRSRLPADTRRPPRLLQPLAPGPTSVDGFDAPLVAGVEPEVAQGLFD